MSIACIIPHFAYPSIDGYLGCVHILPTVNNAAMNIGMQISLSDPVFNSSVYIFRVVKIVEIDTRRVAARGWGKEEMRRHCLMETVSVTQDEKRYGDGWW